MLSRKAQINCAIANTWCLLFFLPSTIHVSATTLLLATSSYPIVMCWKVAPIVSFVVVDVVGVEGLATM